MQTRFKYYTAIMFFCSKDESSLPLHFGIGLFHFPSGRHVISLLYFGVNPTLSPPIKRGHVNVQVDPTEFPLLHRGILPPKICDSSGLHSLNLFAKHMLDTLEV